jgi:hypothetical protein
MTVMMKLVEECSGTGELLQNGQSLRPITYQVRRFQGMTEGSGMPIPGLFRIEGAVQMDSSEWIGTSLGLKLDDGRVLGITIVDAEGNILSEGHGPSVCLCC